MFEISQLMFLISITLNFVNCVGPILRLSDISDITSDVLNITTLYPPCHSASRPHVAGEHARNPMIAGITCILLSAPTGHQMFVQVFVHTRERKFNEPNYRRHNLHFHPGPQRIATRDGLGVMQETQ